jgi:DNA primase
VATVATGATGGARRMHWIARLALCSAVLVAYDADTAGDTAAAYWLERLENARRWRPYWGDANEMAQAGADVRAWVAAGVGERAKMDSSIIS